MALSWLIGVLSSDGSASWILKLVRLFSRMSWRWYSHLQPVSRDLKNHEPCSLLGYEYFVPNSMVCVKFCIESGHTHIHTDSPAGCFSCFSLISPCTNNPAATTIQKLIALGLCWRGHTKMLSLSLEPLWNLDIRDPDKNWRRFFFTYFYIHYLWNATCTIVCNWGSDAVAAAAAAVDAPLFRLWCCCCCSSCTMLAMAAEEAWGGARFGLTGRPAKDGNGGWIGCPGGTPPNTGIVFLPGIPIPRPRGSGAPGIIGQGKWAPGMCGNGTAAAALFISRTPITP